MTSYSLNSIATAKTDGLAMQTVWLTGARIIALFSSVMLPIVLVRLFSQTEFGVYKQAFQILSTAVSLFGLQVASSIYYFIPREPRKRPQVAMNVLVFYGVIGLLVALFCALYPRWITMIFKSDDLVADIPMLGLAILLWLISSNLESFVLVNREARLASLFFVIVNVTKPTLLVGSALLFGTIRALILAAVVQGALQCVIMLTYVYRRFGPFWQGFDRQLFQAQIASALPFGLGGLAYTAQNDLHNYFVSHYFDAAAFAIYSVGCFQLPLLTALFDAVDMVLNPEAARLQEGGSTKRLVTVWLNAIRGLALCFVPVCAWLFVMRREVIVSLFTERYVGAVPIFAINIFSLLLWFPNGAIVRAFSELRYFRFKLYFVLLPLSCVALYFGIQTAGLIGAITATVVVRFLDVAFTSLTVSRSLGLKRRDFPTAEIIRIGASVGIAALFTFFVRVILESLPLIIRLGICSAVFWIVYLTTALLTGAVSAEEKSKIRSFISELYRRRLLRIDVSPETEGSRVP